MGYVVHVPKIKSLPDSGIYFGGYKNGLFHGKGEIVWSNGERYVGEFKDGRFDGNGKITFSNGDHYEGDFVKGLFHGKGTLTRKNGTYIGEFIKGYMEGYGELITKSYIYKGQFKDDTFNGKGKFFPDPMHGTYEGMFKDGEIIHGLWTGPTSKRSYNGDFKYSMFDGKGIFSDGVVGYTYEGEFWGGVKQGRGIIKARNGIAFDGYFRLGLPDGEGTFTDIKGIKHKGIAKNGVMSGINIMNEIFIQKREVNGGEEEHKTVLKQHAENIYDKSAKNISPDSILGYWKSDVVKNGLFEVIKDVDNPGKYYAIQASGDNSSAKPGDKISEVSYNEDSYIFTGRHIWSQGYGDEQRWSDWGSLEIKLLDKEHLFMRFLDSVYKDGWIYEKQQK